MEKVRIAVICIVVGLVLGVVLGEAVPIYPAPTATVTKTETSTVTTTATTTHTTTATETVTAPPSPPPTISPYLKMFRDYPDLFVSHTFVRVFLFMDESGKEYGKLTSVSETRREGSEVHETLRFNFTAQPTVENVWFQVGFIWCLTEGPIPVPIPVPGLEPVTLGNGGSLVLSNDSSSFKEEWEWVQLTVRSHVACFNLTLSDGRHLIAYWTDHLPDPEAGRLTIDNRSYSMYDSVAVIGDLLGFLYRNKVEIDNIRVTVFESTSFATITGTYRCVPNPCTTQPCLPGMVWAAIVEDTPYYLTVDGGWIWDCTEKSWDGYAPKEGDYVKVIGYVSKMIDVFGDSFYEIEVESLKPA